MRLYRSSNAILPKNASAPLVSGMLLGALLGPMNGSVGASVLGLSRVVSPKLTAEGAPAATRDAHTFAETMTGRTDRVINTQDVFHAALVPAIVFILLCLALAWFAGRGEKLPPGEREPLKTQEGILAAVALTALLVLLGGVATGYFFAVEAAAVGAFTLLCAGLLTGALHRKAMQELLHDAIAITGALFSLLIAATTFTLILRLLGTDRLVNNLVAGIPGGDIPATAVVLAVIGLCAFVLDAFEIIFVIVPIVIPPLLVRVADARWVSVLVLLTLQSSFLLPPFGYALMMVRGAAKNSAPFRPFVRALVPFLLAQWVLLVVVLLVPRLVHFGEDAASSSRASSLSNADIDQRMRDMLPLPPPPPPPTFDQK
jgi:TRAP-type mannitol/chloroaromatic compound transport system permease large subunit